MCFKIGKSSSYNSSKTKATDVEAKDAEEVSKKQRLLETKGKNNGQILTSSQTRSLRNIFGN